MSFLRKYLGCEFGIHAYDKWTDANRYGMRVKNTDFGAGTLEGVPYWIQKGEVITQMRTCQECGIKQSREVML